MIAIKTENINKMSEQLFLEYKAGNYLHIEFEGHLPPFLCMNDVSNKFPTTNIVPSVVKALQDITNAIAHQSSLNLSKRGKFENISNHLPIS